MTYLSNSLIVLIASNACYLFSSFKMPANELNALSFIYNYLVFVLPQMMGLSWSHAKVLVAWVGPKSFDDRRSNEQLLQEALALIARENGWKNPYVKDEGTITYCYKIDGNQRVAIFNRKIFGHRDGDEECELVYDFLPFRNVLNNVLCLGKRVEETECRGVYENYKETLMEYTAENYPNIESVTMQPRFIFV